LSPLKKGRNRENCNYFHGKISNGNKSVKFFSFEPKLRSSIEKLKDQNTSLALTDCRVQTNKFDSNLEVVTTRFSTVEDSPKKF
uniref:Uncharacterized protein n=1 Tax=Amphimedon queenslandica TaxID=400682 RepID=A0A1X7UUB5_AMPQE